jgi:hypothetical protein
MRRELQELRHELADERRNSERLEAELLPLREELQMLRGEVERLKLEKVEGDAALARRDAALAKLSDVDVQRDEARQALEQAIAERDELDRANRRMQLERDRMTSALDHLRADGALAAEVHERALAEREHALRARDHAIAERDRALTERDELARVGESIQSQRAAARALVTRRNLAWRGSPWSAPTRRKPGASPDILRREIGWPARIVALVLLIGAVVVLAAILHLV